MTGSRSSLLLVLALASWAHAAPPAPHVEVRITQTYGPLGGTVLTLWSDGYVEEIATKRGSSQHLSGQLSEENLGKVVAGLQASGLAPEQFTQRSRHPIIQHGVWRLELWDGERLHELTKPPLEEPNAATKALAARMKAQIQSVRDSVRPHLIVGGEEGRYVSAQAMSVVPAQFLNPPAEGTARGRLPQALQQALARLGSYVRLPKADRDAVSHGAQDTVDGLKVAWLILEFSEAAPTRATSDR